MAHEDQRILYVLAFSTLIVHDRCHTVSVQTSCVYTEFLYKTVKIGGPHFSIDTSTYFTFSKLFKVIFRSIHLAH